MTKENTEIAANQNHSITNSLNFNHNPSYHAPVIPVGDIHRLQQDSPALADRIVGLLEKEQIHRQELEKKVVTLEEREQVIRQVAVDAEIKITGKGQNYSLVITILFVIASIISTAMGNYAAGAIAVGFPVAMIVASIMGKARNKNRTEKAAEDASVPS